MRHRKDFALTVPHEEFLAFTRVERRNVTKLAPRSTYEMLSDSNPEDVSHKALISSKSVLLQNHRGRAWFQGEKVFPRFLDSPYIGTFQPNIHS